MKWPPKWFAKGSHANGGETAQETQTLAPLCLSPDLRPSEGIYLLVVGSTQGPFAKAWIGRALRATVFPAITLKHIHPLPPDGNIFSGFNHGS